MTPKEFVTKLEAYANYNTVRSNALGKELSIFEYSNKQLGEIRRELYAEHARCTGHSVQRYADLFLKS
jgi:hypothetical protein